MISNRISRVFLTMNVRSEQGQKGSDGLVCVDIQGEIIQAKRKSNDPKARSPLAIQNTARRNR